MSPSKRELAELIYDYAERIFLTILGFSIIIRFLPSIGRHPVDAILLVSELAAVAMIVIRKRATTGIDLSAQAILVALVGTTGGLLVQPGGGSGLIPEWLAAAVMVTGGLLNIAAKVALNRSFGLTAANRGVKRSGPYRLMRHPMYAGYITTQIGFLLANPTAWNLTLYAIAWTAQILRIRAEERVLSKDAAYQAYAAAVPFRLAPGVY